MAIKHTEDFKQEAVRITLTSGLPRLLVASDLGVGFSTLSKLVPEFRHVDTSIAPQADLATKLDYKTTR
jgi:transposase